MKYFLLLNLFFLTAATTNFAQAVNSSISLPLLANEQWWGGGVQYGYQMPFNAASSFSFNLYGDISNNQSAPLLVSSKGACCTTHIMLIKIIVFRCLHKYLKLCKGKNNTRKNYSSAFN
jgi:hypothetical protein